METLTDMQIRDLLTYNHRIEEVTVHTLRIMAPIST